MFEEKRAEISKFMVDEQVGGKEHKLGKEVQVTEELEEIFQVFDEDLDGFISPEEMISTMESMGGTISKEEIDAMIEKADLNGDGKISICEFVKIYSD